MTAQNDNIAARIYAREIWEQLLPEDQLEFVLGTEDTTQWWTDTALETLSHFREDPQAWGRICSQALAYRLSPRRLEAAVDALILLRNATSPHEETPLQQPYVAPPILPPLPAGARCLKSWEGAAPWLDAYIAHSQRWSPRGIAGAHAAVGLWVLSTVAARRIACEVGSSTVYPVLLMAMVARSTLYAKSTTAAVGRDLLRRAGCSFFLTADRTTPQALLRSMAGLVPSQYGSMHGEAQEEVRKRLAFAGQRGSYFEEWGGMLHQMRRTDSPMAEFHTLLRVLDDNQPTYSNDTIQRGIESIQSPYLALLASATPHDLAPFMMQGSAWWHDGFWPRFALIVPQEDEQPSLVQRERRGYTIPASLIEPLWTWHAQLGMPEASIEAMLDSKGKLTGAWQATIGALPQRTLGIDDEVYDAYEAYNDGLLRLLQTGDVPQDYDASYGRFHEKALRIALLLAAFAGKHTIGIEHWSYAQHIVEGWRKNLHVLVGRIAADHPLTPEEQAEQKILLYLGQVGHASARDIQRHLHTLSSQALGQVLSGMAKLGHLYTQQSGRTTMYGLLPTDDIVTNQEKNDVPF